MYNNTQASIDKIWTPVENVWNETSSSEVARALVLAYTRRYQTFAHQGPKYRVMDVIIKEDGNNDFLSNGTPHFNVRRDYKDTTTGIKPMLANFMF